MNLIRGTNEKTKIAGVWGTLMNAHRSTANDWASSFTTLQKFVTSFTNFFEVLFLNLTTSNVNVLIRYSSPGIHFEQIFSGIESVEFLRFFVVRSVWRQSCFINSWSLRDSYHFVVVMIGFYSKTSLESLSFSFTNEEHIASRVLLTPTMPSEIKIYNENCNVIKESQQYIVLFR